MTKLSDTQLIVLASACRRDDGLAIRPPALKGGAAAKLVASLTAKGFIREIRAKPGVPVWREDDSGRFALKILKAGRDAIGVEDMPDAVGEGEEADQAAPVAAAVAKPTSTSTAAPRIVSASKSTSSKRDQVIALLGRKQGATMENLIGATSWLPHTTRAFLSGLRKAGLDVTRSKDGEAASVYWIVRKDFAAAA